MDHARRAVHVARDHRDGQHDPERRDPVADDDLDASNSRGPVDHRRLHARLRRAAADHRQSSATASAARARCKSASSCSAWVRSSAALSDSTPAPDRHPGVHGHRRRSDHAVDAVDPHQRVPRPTASVAGPSPSGPALRSRRGHRPGDRRHPAAPLLVELGVLGEHPHRHRCPRARRLPHPDSRDPNQASSTRSAPRCRSSACSRCCSASSKARCTAGPTRSSSPPSVSACRPGGLHRLGVARRRADARHALFRNPRFSAANGAITLMFFACSARCS